MPRFRKEYTRTPSVVTEYMEAFIRNCIVTDAMEGLKKQTHTAKRIFYRLVTEKKFTGSYSIVRRVVHEVKDDFVPTQADIPLEYDPGDVNQIDWGEVTVYLGGERKTIQIFCGRLYKILKGGSGLSDAGRVTQASDRQKIQPAAHE